VAECGQNFFSRTDLRLHTENKHGSNEFMCELCSKISPSEYMLRRHHLMIHGEFRFVCSYENCDAKYRKSYDLKLHVAKIHKKSRDFLCKFCGKAFFSFCKQKSHEKIHTNARIPCVVPDCKSELSRRDSAINHLKSHRELSKEQLKNYLQEIDEFCVKNNILKSLPTRSD
jgi:uncharacterized Zn-finger protein